jgi:cytochrome c-type biogenesis protein CcmH/NrfG
MRGWPSGISQIADAIRRCDLRSEGCWSAPVPRTDGYVRLLGPVLRDHRSHRQLERQGKMGTMQIRIMKLGLVCLVAGAVLLLVIYSAKRPADESAEARGVMTAHVTPREMPGTGGHDLKVLEQALTRKPGHTPVLMNLAKLEEEKGRLHEAVQHLKEILGGEPGNLEARLELGRVLFQLGDIEGALAQTQAILKVQPTNPDALYNLGAIYGNLGNAARAREYWERLIALEPQSESGKRAQRMLPQLAGMSR